MAGRWYVTSIHNIDVCNDDWRSLDLYSCGFVQLLFHFRPQTHETSIIFKGKLIYSPVSVVLIHIAPKMDLVLDVLDRNLLTPYVYPATWKEDDMSRQFTTIMLVLNLGAAFFYIAVASFNFYFIFDHRLMKHPLFLKVRWYWWQLERLNWGGREMRNRRDEMRQK